MYAIAVTMVAATTTRGPQSDWASWALRLGLPPLGQVTTGRATDITDRHMAPVTATTATRIRIEAVIITHIEG
jgi:hypothetical protein